MGQRSSSGLALAVCFPFSGLSGVRPCFLPPSPSFSDAILCRVRVVAGVLGGGGAGVGGRGAEGGAAVGAHIDCNDNRCGRTGRTIRLARQRYILTRLSTFLGVLTENISIAALKGRSSRSVLNSGVRKAAAGAGVQVEAVVVPY